MRTVDYGVGYLHAPNDTYLHWKQWSEDRDAFIDEVWLRRDKHIPYRPVPEPPACAAGHGARRRADTPA